MHIRDCKIGSIVLTTCLSIIINGQTKNMGVKLKNKSVTYYECTDIEDHVSQRYHDTVRNILV
jgi:hypothetical protein